ncbi:type IV pilus modification protein PilV [Aliamphritea hakodatensis]|uniref:type IV pilus modification protein PilV n=1 Tax=Aliamphritea hakodatensis TaxID=2895352 RepID=UPI0022FD7FF3|nr:type IV pilus modification protein PilV [Aliamphritea hakodatensis]
MSSLTPRFFSAGVSLIEVLISIVLISVVMLGVAAFAITSLSENQSAYIRSQASFLAYDIASRIRINKDFALADDGNYALDTSSIPNTPAAVNCITTVAGCDETDLAAQDIREWTEHFRDVAGIGVNGAGYQATIPNAIGVVAVSAGDIAVTISWQENDWNVVGDNLSGIETHQLRLNFRVVQ